MKAHHPHLGAGMTYYSPRAETVVQHLVKSDEFFGRVGRHRGYMRDLLEQASTWHLRHAYELLWSNGWRP